MSKDGHISNSSNLMSKYLPLKTELTPEMMQKARTELNETPGRKIEALEELKKLIEKEEDFQPLMDDNFLTRFLRAKKFNTEEAFKALKHYYTYKVRYSGTLTDILPIQVKHVYDMNVLTLLPYRDPDGCMIGIGKLGCFDFDKLTTDELLAAIILAVDVSLQSEANQVCGAVFIGDFKSLTLRRVRHLSSPSLVYRFFRAIQDCAGLRIKAIHIVNEPFYFSIIFSIIKRFLSEKMKNRFQLHGSNFERLHKLISPEILPEEIGGHLGPMTSTEFTKEILSSENLVLKSSTHGYRGMRADYIRRKSSFNLELYK